MKLEEGSAIRLLYRDVDRIPYLLAVQAAARARGLDVELIRHRQVGDEDWGEKLRRGEVDTIAENYWALVKYRAEGAPFVTVAGASHWWRDKLLARAGIVTLRDLAGKRLALRSIGPGRWFPSVFFGQLGMADDVTLDVIPEAKTGRYGLWKAVASGECDACFCSPLYIEPALAAGLHEVAFPPWPFDGGHIVPTLTEAYVATHQDAVQALVDAMFDACVRCSTDHAYMRDLVRQGTDLLRDYHTIESEADIERLALLLGVEIAPNPIPTLRGILNARDLAAAWSPELRDFDPLLMWDLSFARNAVANGAHV